MLATKNISRWFINALKIMVKPDAPAGTAADPKHSWHFQPAVDGQSGGFLSG